MSRSSSIVIAHIMYVCAAAGQHITLRDVLAFVKTKRPRASPNGGFMAQLIDLEVALFGSPSIDIDKYRSNRFGDVHEYAIGHVSPLLWPIHEDSPDDVTDEELTVE
jgi:hypothetical protein